MISCSTIIILVVQRVREDNILFSRGITSRKIACICNEEEIFFLIVRERETALYTGKK